MSHRVLIAEDRRTTPGAEEVFAPLQAAIDEQLPTTS